MQTLSFSKDSKHVINYYSYCYNCYNLLFSKINLMIHSVTTVEKQKSNFCEEIWPDYN